MWLLMSYDLEFSFLSNYINEEGYSIWLLKLERALIKTSLLLQLRPRVDILTILPSRYRNFLNLKTRAFSYFIPPHLEKNTNGEICVKRNCISKVIFKELKEPV